MKIKTKNQKKSRKKLIIFIVIGVILLAGAYTAVASLTNLWPFAPSTTTSKTSDKDQDKQDTNNKDPETKPNEDKTNNNPEENYVKPDITNPPTNNTPYPIENERYRIDQNSPTSYTVELYPIINNPEYSDYDAQLKDYKNEVLSYLKSRYGNIDNFNIEWIPEDAKDL